jgi:hypothetical protein
MRKELSRYFMVMKSEGARDRYLQIQRPLELYGDEGGGENWFRWGEEFNKATPFPSFKEADEAVAKVGGIVVTITVNRQ